MKTKFYNHIVQLQKTICDEFEQIDEKAGFLKTNGQETAVAEE